MTETSSPRFAVVVATRDRGAKIVPLLDSVVRSREPDFEMVIIDQSAGDETRRAVEPFLADQRLRYVHTTARGASRARNRGAQLTTAPIIVITDDDCIVPPNWLVSIAAPFEVDSKVGVVFCNVDPVPFDLPGHTPHIHFAGNRTVRSVREAWTNSRRGMSLGAGMAIRRTTFDDVGGFDSVLGPGGTFQAAEDNDLAWRALVRGWLVFENADATVLHDGFRSLDELRELVKRDFYGVGGTTAKYVKAGHWHIASLIISWTVRFGVVDPARQILAGQRPTGFRRPYMLLRGLLDGLRAPLDKTNLRYRD